MNRVLIVEDDRLLNDGIAFALQQDGYEVFQAYNGEECKKLLYSRPHLIILDINLPDNIGFDLCNYIREGIATSIVFLTAKDTEEDVIAGFRAGGDDYITKPFSIAILKERIKAILKRSSDNKSLYFYKNIIFDIDKLVLTKDDIAIGLTATELKLIRLLIENRGRVVTREQILDRVWDIDGDFVDENTLSVNIRRLRSKIEDNPTKPTLIKTVFGIGYTWGDDR